MPSQSLISREIRQCLSDYCEDAHAPTFGCFVCVCAEYMCLFVPAVFNRLLNTASHISLMSGAGRPLDMPLLLQIYDTHISIAIYFLFCVAFFW